MSKRNGLGLLYYPTEEEVFDVNFSAIVSDLRGIIRGTIVPRTWADISGTWHDGEYEVKNKQLHRSAMPGLKVLNRRYTYQRKTPIRPKKVYERVFRERVVREKVRQRKLTEQEKIVMRALRRMGISLQDARNRAIELFGGNNG